MKATEKASARKTCEKAQITAKILSLTFRPPPPPPLPFTPPPPHSSPPLTPPHPLTPPPPSLTATKKEKEGKKTARFVAICDPVVARQVLETPS